MSTPFSDWTGLTCVQQVADGYWRHFGSNGGEWECFWCGTIWSDQFVDEVMQGEHIDDVTVHRAIHKLNPQWRFHTSSITSSTSWAIAGS